MTDRRRLIVMRHAKAEPFAATDHARRLTDRGTADARDAGRHLHRHGLVPDFVLVSSAVRTRQTWSAVTESLQVPEDVVTYDDAVFTGSAEVALESLRGAPEGAATVMFVGHNPTAADLCHLLDDGEGDPGPMSGLLRGFPPGALAILELAAPWTTLGPESGRVVGYHVGRS